MYLQSSLHTYIIYIYSYIYILYQSIKIVCSIPYICIWISWFHCKSCCKICSLREPPCRLQAYAFISFSDHRLILHANLKWPPGSEPGLCAKIAVQQMLPWAKDKCSARGSPCFTFGTVLSCLSQKHSSFVQQWDEKERWYKKIMMPLVNDDQDLPVQSSQQKMRQERKGDNQNAARTRKLHCGQGNLLRFGRALGCTRVLWLFDSLSAGHNRHTIGILDSERPGLQWVAAPRFLVESKQWRWNWLEIRKMGSQ